MAEHGQDEWLTAILRPAGTLDEQALERLGAALTQLADDSDMAVLDLSATRYASARSVARELRRPAAEFERAGRCLLLVGASGELSAELDRAHVPVITLPADSLPVPGPGPGPGPVPRRVPGAVREPGAGAVSVPGRAVRGQAVSGQAVGRA
jgi:hypothetical protein